MGGHSPEAGGHDAPKEGIAAEAESLSHDMKEHAESREDLLSHYSEKLRSFFDRAGALFDTGSEETQEKVMEAVNHLFSILKEFGVNIYESASEDFRVGLTLVREQFADAVDHATDGDHEMSEEEFNELVEHMSAEELKNFLGNLDLPSVSPEQEERIEQVSLMVSLLGALKDEFKRGGETWTMWTARIFASDEVEQKTSGAIGAAAERAEKEATIKILKDPSLTLDAVVPDLMGFFRNPPSIAGAIMSPVNFGEGQNLNQVRAEAMQALRDMKHYEEAGLIASSVLDPYLKKGRDLVPPLVASNLRNTIGLELHNPERFYKLKEEAMAHGVPEKSVHDYIAEVWEAIYQVELRKLSAGYINPSKLPADVKPVWEQYNDMYDPQGEWTNMSDYNRDFLVEELMVQGALLLATAATGVGAAAVTARMGASTISFMRATTLVRYLPKAVRTAEFIAGLEVSADVASGLGRGAKALNKLGSEALAQELFYQGAHIMGDEMSLQEVLDHAPEWGKNVLWRMATLGIMGRAEKLAAGITPTLVSSFTSKITSEPMRKIAEQLLFTDHVQAAAFLIVTAIKEGAYEGDPKGFMDHFGGHLYHAYGEIWGTKMAHNKLHAAAAHH